ncbi:MULTISPECIES: sensor histidine kinase [Heyndrickxia]|uniref:sensor histidine kinase n=1 Tax=Heyndrickxia TaxID=2837504 RepID=UPI002DBED265|nr:HAMP domain-containing sensor histidine kinase [Weizmannia sp. CD-2023]MEC2304065.1 HAMP domain-containing sensor histidine kinase [Weizmannia sp. CD-2023]MEC2339467.1 HAMP domain-containing sensor histidine kinase [Weizmannia sp. CD-2023]
MFRKTRIKLTALNACVFILLIAVLGTVIYMYVRTHMYSEADQSIYRALDRIEKKGGSLAGDPHGNDIRLRILIWDKNNNLMSTPSDGPDVYLYEQYAAEFAPAHVHLMETIKVAGHYFRTYTVKGMMQNEDVKIQFLAQIDGEVLMLHKLMIITIAGCALASLLAVIAGLVLAERALKPIKAAWDKQTQFVSDASHEIRTPLAVIQSRVELLLRKPNETVRDVLPDISTVLNECRRLTKLVSNLLTLARSDSDKIEIERKPFYLDELLREIMDHFSELAAIQGKTLILKSAPPVTFSGDRDRIHQLIVILLDNAMKYTGDGGKIELACFESKNHVGISVQDNGIGLKEEDREKIFDRFFQVSKSRTKTESLGLGLSIAKWIVEKHSGKIRVDSKLGEGTTFTITFPKKKRKDAQVKKSGK